MNKAIIFSLLVYAAFSGANDHTYDDKDNTLSLDALHQIMTGVAVGTLDYLFTLLVTGPITDRIFPPARVPKCSCTMNKPVLKKWGYVIYASINEEVLFRWAMQPLLSSYLLHFFKTTNLEPYTQGVIATYSSICVTSIIFGLMHLFNRTGGWGQVSRAAIAGFILSYVYSNHGLLASVVCHITHNLFVLYLHY